jgi:hypothetical protein
MAYNNLLEIKEKIKKDLIIYYDSLKSQIDIDIQETLIKQHDLTNNDKNSLIVINKELIDKVDSNCDQNMYEINNYFDSLKELNSLFSNMVDLNSFFEDDKMICEFQNQNKKSTNNDPHNESLKKSIDESTIKIAALKKYCLYISKAKLNSRLPNGQIPHGILISFNWYPNENQLNYTK